MRNTINNQANLVELNSKERENSLDNIRFFLIFLVVFAHLLEVSTPFVGSDLIYRIIYTFHMPAFIFLFGYNVKYHPKRIVFRWCIPYLIFQSAYIVYSGVVLGDSIKFQYTTPYWLLWYMLVCIFYQLLIPLYDTSNKTRQVLGVVCTIALSLIIGFDDSTALYLSLSRFFVFQPWFMLGYYCKKNKIIEYILKRKKMHFTSFILSIAIIILSAFLLIHKDIPTVLMYGPVPYYACNGSLWMRAILFVVAFGWILFLFISIKPYLDVKIPFITNIGQNTWSIFLLHGFLTRAIPIYSTCHPASFLTVFLITCCILILLGNKLLNKFIYYFCFCWLE